MSTRPFVLVALVGLATPALAQRRSGPSLSVGGDAVYSTIGANARDSRIGDGVGYDAHAGVVWGPLGASVGYQRTEHKFSSLSDKATYTTTYVEPRVNLQFGDANFTPYLAGRVGRTHVVLPALALTTSTTTTATAYALGGGVAVNLARSIALDLGALWTTTDYKQAAFTSDVLHGGEHGATMHAGIRVTP